MSSFEIVNQELISDKGFIKFVKNTILEKTSDTKFTRECIVHCGASVVLPIMKNGDAILIKQYRNTFDEEILEVVAGRIDADDENPLSCAKRELLEEAGVASNNFVDMGSWLVSPGWTNEVNYGFVALDCEEPIDTKPDGIEEKLAQVIRLPFEEVLKMLSDGVISDAKSIILIQRAAAYINSH